MRKLLCVIALCLFASAASAADPKIVGAEQPVPLGELVSLSVTPPEDNKGPSPAVSVKYDWSVFEWDKKKGTFAPKRVKVDLDGGVCFGAGIVAKKVLVHCAVTSTYAVKDKDGKVTALKADTFLLSAVVTIGDAEPTPPDAPPAPTPDPTPADAEPDFGTGKWAPMSKLAWKATKNVDPAARAAAKALAASFRNTAGQIGTTLKGQKAILAAAVASNDAALGDTKESWKPWSDSLSDALLKLANAGQLANDSDLQAALTAVADGLDKVK
jgi:hypothetical protein